MKIASDMKTKKSKRLMSHLRRLVERRQKIKSTHLLMVFFSIAILFGVLLRLIIPNN